MTGKKVFAACLVAMTIVLTAGCSGNMLWASASREPEEVRREAENRMEAVELLGKISIGISTDYAPFAFQIPIGEDAFSYVGADVELGRYIAEELGVDVEFREMEFEDCLTAVEEGSVDLVLLGMLPKAEREKMMDFTNLYYEPGRQVILVKKTQKDRLSDLSDYEGKTMAAQYGSLQAQLVTEQMPGSYMEVTENVSEAILMLRLGSVDGVVLDEAMAELILKEHTELALSGTELAYEAEGIVGGVVKGETELLERVNEILEKVSGEKLYFEWLDAANQQAMSLNPPIP